MPGTSARTDALPGPGEWDGPIFGDLGVLATDGEKVQCHACAAIRFAQIMNGSFGGMGSKLAVL